MNGRHKIRNASSPKFIPIIGMNHLCSNTMRTRLLESVYLKKNNREFSVTTMKILVEVTLLHRRQLRRLSNIGSTGLPSLRMLTRCAEVVIDAKDS